MKSSSLPEKVNREAQFSSFVKHQEHLIFEIWTCCKSFRSFCHVGRDLISTPFLPRKTPIFVYLLTLPYIHPAVDCRLRDFLKLGCESCDRTLTNIQLFLLSDTPVYHTYNIRRPPVSLPLAIPFPYYL